MNIFKKSIVIAVMITLSSCGAVLTNPTVETKEFKVELAKQTRLLEAYKNKNKKPTKNTKLFKNVYQYDAYLANYMDTIMVKNSDLCGYKMYSIGVQYADKVILKGKNYSKKYKDYPQIYGLTKNFPAQKAGLKKGDIFLYVHRRNVKRMGFNDMVKKLNTSYISTIKIYRPSTGENKTFRIIALKTCQMLLMTYDDKMLNATADGTVVRMYTGLINFLGKKQYIHAVLAHEMAHNIMAHRYRSTRNHLTGQLLGALLGVALANNNGGDPTRAAEDMASLGANFANLTYSHEFEAEADYLGAYLLARAGYNIDNIANTWRRMSLLSQNSNDLGTTTHPASPKRFVALSKSIKEIDRKIKMNTKLLPKFKESSWSEIKDKQRSVY